MKLYGALLLAASALLACTAQNPYDPLADYEEVSAVSVLDAPAPVAVGPEQRKAAAHGKYLVELLGCGSCHTDGALIGEPRAERRLAGSRIGIAYSNPLANRYPGIVFAPNITPDLRTGIGAWTENQIVDAIRAGVGRHGNRRILVMPWQGFQKISDEDVNAIAQYLRSLEPVAHQVPAEVAPGKPTSEAFVHFGIYRPR